MSEKVSKYIHHISESFWSLVQAIDEDYFDADELTEISGCCASYEDYVAWLRDHARDQSSRKTAKKELDDIWGKNE